MIGVLLIIPRSVSRLGIRSILAADPELNIVAEWARPNEAVDILAEVDVVVLQLEALRRQDLALFSVESDARFDGGVLVLSDNEKDVLKLSGSGLAAWGILSEDAAPEEILSAVHAVGDGLITASPELLGPALAQVVLNPETDPEPLDEPLTERELEVLDLLAEGMPNKQIAGALYISEHTVKFHISSIIAKLGAGNRTEAVRLGMQRGLISL